MSKWSYEYKKRLPDSAYLVVLPGGHKERGRTSPQSLRHFPVRDIKGKLSATHIRSVLGSYGQRSKIPAAAKKAAMKKAKVLLEKMHAEAGKSKRKHSTAKRGRSIPPPVKSGVRLIKQARDLTVVEAKNVAKVLRAMGEHMVERATMKDQATREYRATRRAA